MAVGPGDSGDLELLFSRTTGPISIKTFLCEEDEGLFKWTTTTYSFGREYRNSPINPDIYEYWWGVSDDEKETNVLSKFWILCIYLKLYQNQIDKLKFLSACVLKVLSSA